LPESAEAAEARRHLATRVSAVGEAFRWTPDHNEIGPQLRVAGWSVEAAVDPAGLPLTASRERAVFVRADVRR
jgi:hypothetical protein